MYKRQGGNRRSAQQTDAWVWPSSSRCVPPVETQAINIVPPGHPCGCPFPSFFSFFFPRFSSPFCCSPCSPSFFVLYFALSFSRLFLVSPSSLFFSLLCFPWWRILFSVLSSRCYTSPALLASLMYAYSPCVLSSFLRSCRWFIAFFFSSFPVFDFDRLFHPIFFLSVQCCVLGFGFCCDSFSMRMI